MYITIVKRSIYILCAFLLSGCVIHGVFADLGPNYHRDIPVAKGPAFNQVTVKNPNKSLLYIYRVANMSQDMKAGNIAKWDLFIDDKKNIRLVNGGYSAIFLSKGKYDLTSKMVCLVCFQPNLPKLSLNVETNKTYYIEWYWDRSKEEAVLALRTEAEALSGLSKTRYSPPKAYAVPGYQEEALKKKGK